MFACSFGLFGSLFFLFLKFLPVIAIAEVKTIMPQAHASHGHGHHGDGHGHGHDDAHGHETTHAEGA